VQAEVVAGGDGIRARIVEVFDRGEGRAVRPVWVLEGDASGPLRLREGSEVELAGVPQRAGTLRSITRTATGSRRFEVEVTGWKTENHLPNGRRVPHAASPALIGAEIVLVSHSVEALARLRSRRVWQRDVPGAWLTHANPTGPALPAEVVGEF
jgi:hypothetical protein